MRIVCISDTHNFHREVSLPEGDVLIHSGDATSSGSLEEASAFARWWDTLDFPYKIFVAGNHDWLWERQPSFADTLVPSLHEKIIEIEGLKVYGASWQPRFMDWAFNVDRGPAIAEKWARIPDDTDILITHGPPCGILDKLEDGTAVGCRDLRERLRDVRPKLVVFGHIHHCRGQIEVDGTRYLNAAICDEAYRAVNKPMVVDL